MRVKLYLAAATFTLALAAFGAAPANADLSKAARATSVLDDRGEPRGLEHYETAAEAIQAGDMAAYLEALAEDVDNEILPSNLRALVLSVDELADSDVEGAREVLTIIRDDEDGDDESQLSAYINSWVAAFEGDETEAISEHRAAASGLPGYTADLSLAAMLEGFGRNEEALAVYASLTPGDITAPDNLFDSRGLYFSHVRTVIARRALLLRRLGRIEEAKEVYRKLAEAEPERAISYAAAIQSLEDGEGLDDENLTPRTALARTLSDISSALAQQRIFRLIRSNRPLNTFDETKATLDQAALLLAPEDENLRNAVIGTLHGQAYYDGAAHVALTAPEATPHLGMSAAFALLLQQDKPAAREALDNAIALEAEEDDKLSILLRAATLYSFLDDDEKALALNTEALEMAENDAERASANAAAANTLQHFARYDEALVFAREAARIDDTHDRRVYVTTVLGELGEHEESLKTLRRELLERPGDPYALNVLGYYLIIHTDEYEDGYKLLARAESLALNNPYIRDSFGWARYKLGDLKVAQQAIESARDRLAPERHWEIEDHLGDIYWHRGEEDAAREAWAAALEVYPPHRVRDSIMDKLENGITDPPPEKRPIPSVSLNDDTAGSERDI